MTAVLPEPQRFAFAGVVEGFYGRVWRPEEREAFIAALVPFGLDTWLYAPKHEAALGAELTAPLDKAASQRLHALHHFCEARGVRLVAGLHFEPPLDPARPDHLEAVGRKVLQLAELGIADFAALFDDLPAVRPGPLPAGADPFGGSLAAAQAHVFLSVQRTLERQGVRAGWLICPSRYSLDPVIEETYGALEPDYLSRLHADLPLEVPWLWTGPRVCSPTIALADRAAFLAGLERPLVLWDNYPVNDAHMQPRLHLAPLDGRAPDLPQGVTGYLFNPLLQPHLGQVPGATCLAYARDPAGYDPTAAWQAALDGLLPAELHGPFRAFTALTHLGPAGGALPEPAPDGAERLAARLHDAWRALRWRESAELSAVRELEEVVQALRTGLPGAMRAEAEPWLAQLERAARLFHATAEGVPPAKLDALWQAYRKAEAEVLGDWFRRGGGEAAAGRVS